MKPFSAFVGDGEEQGVGATLDNMDLDGDSLDLLGDALLDTKPLDADFFNNFQDDFDDTDIA